MEQNQVTDRHRSASPPPIEGDGGVVASRPSDPEASQTRDTGSTGNRAAPGRAFSPAFHRRGARAPVYAALDLGTNNCRLLIARPTDLAFRVVDGYSRIVRLGEGISRTGLLAEEAIARTLGALAQCRAKLDNHNVRARRLIATEACRSAENAGQFLGRVRDEIGLDLEVVDRRTEAELAVTGCADLVEEGASGAILFDIGGGSSELAWLDFRGGRPKNRGRMAASIRSWQSMPVGVVSIAEKFGGKDVDAALFEQMVDYVAGFLKSFRGREKLARAMREHPMHLVGTSGTVTTLAGLHLGLSRYDRSKVDGLWLNDAHVADTMRVLMAMDYDRRVANACIGRDRADLVIPGCAIFEAIRREWPCDRVRVADRGLREGMLISLMAEDRVWSRGRRRGPQRRRGRVDG